MKGFAALWLCAWAGLAPAQDHEIRRALIERDQQSAAFAAGVRGGAEARREAEAQHEAQLREVQRATLVEPSQLPFPDAPRARLAQENALRFAPPVPREPARAAPRREPLPLPGGPRPGVDPVLPQGLPY